MRNFLALFVIELKNVKNDKSLTIHKLNNNLYKYMMDEKLKILLCEDDENLGMLLREFLQAKGFNADLCPDGEKGYKTFLKREI